MQPISCSFLPTCINLFPVYLRYSYKSFFYGDFGIDIYSDKERKDRIGEMHASLDDDGICLSYDLTRDFAFTFDASSLSLIDLISSFLITQIIPIHFKMLRHLIKMAT